MSAVTEHFDGARPNFNKVYNGKVNDRNKDIQAAGIMTYGDGDHVDACLREPVPASAPPETVQKYRNFTDPQLGTVRTHYGKTYDPKHYEGMAHGMFLSDQNDTVKNRINPPLDSFFKHRQLSLNESIYSSNKTKPLGQIPIFNLPKTIDPNTHTFGAKTEKSEYAGELVNPNKTRSQVAIESDASRDLYRYTHFDYDAGEQKTRRYQQPFKKNELFGLTVPYHNDGRFAKQTMEWFPQTMLDKRAQVDSKLLEDFKEKYTNQLGKTLDPKKRDTICWPGSCVRSE